MKGWVRRSRTAASCGAKALFRGLTKASEFDRPAGDRASFIARPPASFAATHDQRPNAKRDNWTDLMNQSQSVIPGRFQETRYRARVSCPLYLKESLKLSLLAIAVRAGEPAHAKVWCNPIEAAAYWMPPSRGMTLAVPSAAVTFTSASEYRWRIAGRDSPFAPRAGSRCRHTSV